MASTTGWSAQDCACQGPRTHNDAMDQQETFAWGLDVPNVSCHYKPRMCQMSCQYEMRMPKTRCLDQLYNTFSFVGHLSWVNQSCYFPKSPSLQLTPKTCQISLVVSSVSKEFHLSMSETNMKRIVMKLEISFLQSLSKKHPRWRCMMLHFSCRCSNCDFLSASMHPQLHSLSYWKVGWVFWSLSQPENPEPSRAVHPHNDFTSISDFLSNPHGVFILTRRALQFFFGIVLLQGSKHFAVHILISTKKILPRLWTQGPHSYDHLGRMEKTVKSLGCNSDRLILQRNQDPQPSHIHLCSWQGGHHSN